MKEYCPDCKKLIEFLTYLTDMHSIAFCTWCGHKKVRVREDLEEQERPRRSTDQ